MKTFEEYIEKMGYSWNDFDSTYEMENLIEQYADEKVKQALTIPAVSGMCEHPWNSVIGDGEMKPAKCLKCGKYL